jgi:hypothetical protein
LHTKHRFDLGQHRAHLGIDLEDRDRRDAATLRGNAVSRVEIWLLAHDKGDIKGYIKQN